MEWMNWTVPTAVFFGVIALFLAGMTAWELRSPSILGVVSCRLPRPVAIGCLSVFSVAPTCTCW